MLSAHRRRTGHRSRCIAIAGLVLPAFLLFAGCTAQSSDTSIFGQLLGPAPEARPSAPHITAAPEPEPDRTGCSSAAECKVVLKTMIESPDRSWIGQRPSPDAYANGTRLFAYRALKKQLTCGELSQAMDELGAVAKALGDATGGMSPDQATRTKALSGQVQVELAKERKGRCRT